MRSKVFLIICFAAWFVGMVLAALMYYAPGAPYRGRSLPVKERLLDQSGDSFSSAAFGSSRIYMGFAPAIFDEAMAPAFRTRTLNLGLWAGTYDDQHKLAVEFASKLHRPPADQPCLMLLEFRAGEIHSGQNQAARHAAAGDLAPDNPDSTMSFAERFQRLRYVIGVARQALIARVRHTQAPGISDVQSVDQQRGQRVDPEAPEAADLLDDGAIARQKAFDPNAPKSTRQDVTEEDLDVLGELQTAVPGVQLAFVYVVYPRFNDLTAFSEYPDHVTVGGHDFPLIDLARPDKYPALYRHENWHDSVHLSGKGSEAVTALFAGELKAWYAVHGAPPSCAQK